MFGKNIRHVMQIWLAGFCWFVSVTTPSHRSSCDSLQQLESLFSIVVIRILNALGFHQCLKVIIWKLMLDTAGNYERKVPIKGLQTFIDCVVRYDIGRDLKPSPGIRGFDNETIVAFVSTGMVFETVQHSLFGHIYLE